MTFLQTVPPASATDAAAAMYDRVRAQHGGVPNWARPFSLRPAVYDGWVALNGAIRSNMTTREYELATLAAARALRSSYCSLAHGRVLADKVFDPPTVAGIMTRADAGALEPREAAMMAFAERIALDASRVTAADVDGLRAHGYADAQIFDVAATAAARCFFSKLLDALGVQADASYRGLDPALRDALTVGRPVAES